MYRQALMAMEGEDHATALNILLELKNKDIISANLNAKESLLRLIILTSSLLQSNQIVRENAQELFEILDMSNSDFDELLKLGKQLFEFNINSLLLG